MNRRFVSALALAASTFLPIASQAMPHGGGEKSSTGKVKMVHLTLHNKSAQPLDLLCGDKPFTIAANGDYKLDAPEGAIVYAADKTTVKLQVTRDLNGTTASFS